MLKDQVRTLAYRNAIKQNPHLFKGKTVLDVSPYLGAANGQPYRAHFELGTDLVGRLRHRYIIHVRVAGGCQACHRYRHEQHP